MIPRGRGRVIALVLAAASTVACGGDAMGGSAADVLDSAGVRVVVNAPPDVTTVPEWVLSETPDLEVGVLEGAPEYQLFQITGAALLHDGTLVIANRGDQQLRFFDSDGVHLRSVGGRGDGPGEFQNLQLSGVFGGDSLLTYDFQQRRASVFGADGTFVRSFRLADGTDLTFPSPAGVLADGRIVVRHGAVFMAGEATSGPDRSPTILFLAGPEGEIMDTLGTFPGSESFVLAEDRMMSVRSVTFGRGLSVAVVGDRIVVANNDGFSVRVYDGSGTLLHLVRQVREPVPVGPDDHARHMESQLAEIEDDEWLRRTRLMLEQMPRHETFPAFASARLDVTGRVWVEEYRAPGDDHPVWQVFDRDGVLAARVRTPSGLRVLEFGEDYVLGVIRDDFDVERVRLYRWDG